MKFARCDVPSSSRTTSWRQVPAQALSVFQLYWYWSDAGSYWSPLEPDVEVSSRPSTGADESQGTACDFGYPSAKISRPWSPFQAEFDRYGLAGSDLVDHGQAVDRSEEPGEVVDHAVSVRLLRRVAGEHQPPG